MLIVSHGENDLSIPYDTSKQTGNGRTNLLRNYTKRNETIYYSSRPVTDALKCPHPGTAIKLEAVSHNKRSPSLVWFALFGLALAGWLFSTM